MGPCRSSWRHSTSGGRRYDCPRGLSLLFQSRRDGLYSVSSGVRINRVFSCYRESVYTKKAIDDQRSLSSDSISFRVWVQRVDMTGRSEPSTEVRTPSSQKRGNVNQSWRTSRQPSTQAHSKQTSAYNKRKTRLCDNWATAGFCPYGARCEFAHGPHELRTRIMLRGETPSLPCAQIVDQEAPYQDIDSKNWSQCPRPNYRNGSPTSGFERNEEMNTDHPLRCNPSQSSSRWVGGPPTLNTHTLWNFRVIVPIPRVRDCRILDLMMDEQAHALIPTGLLA
jgi:hypothetical protein